MLIVPSRTVVGKHSLSVAEIKKLLLLDSRYLLIIPVSVGDFFHVYIKHDSPFKQVCVIDMLVGLNSSHFASGLSKLPHEKH